MSKTDELNAADEDMQEEYDLSGGVRGKYAGRFPAGSKAVLIAPDLAEMFPDSDAVNEALRTFVRIMTPAKQKADGIGVGTEQSLAAIAKS